jgi:hypothetical protein
MPPSLVIVLALEAAPRIYSDTLNDAEANRLCDWIGSHPDLAGLLDRAIEVREAWERRAAA